MSQIARLPTRYDVSLPVRFRSEQDLGWTPGQLANLSSGGLCIVSPNADLLPGQALEILVETTDKFLRTTARRIKARVVWSRDGRHGVQFARAAPDPFQSSPR